MSTPTSGDLLLVNRGGVNYQIDYDDMSTLQDTDLLLVNRAGVNYQIAASDINLGPDGVILPSVDVLTPLNGAGLDEGSAYTPLSSAYVSTDSTPIYRRYFPELITTVSGGTWVNENNIFDNDTNTYAELTGVADAVSQVVFTAPSTWVDGETSVYASNVSGGDGGSIEVLDGSDSVLRTYTLPGALSETAIGIVRVGNKIRFTTSYQNIGLYLAHIVRAHTDYVISGRVAFEFTDDTDLDKMVAPIIMTDENGDIKVPTTSTVDSTTSITGEKKGAYLGFTGNGAAKVIAAGADQESAVPGTRMLWAKGNNQQGGIISDNVVSYGKFIDTSYLYGQNSVFGPELRPTETYYPFGSPYFNNTGSSTYTAEIGVAPKVLDIVQWTGDGTTREILHNLGTKPGMIIIKRVETNGNFVVWDKDLTPGEDLYLNTNRGESTSVVFESEPTKDAFYISNNNDCNVNGGEYVAYVFAADTPGKVQCGTYTGNGSGYKPVGLGFEPGFVLIKRTDASEDWYAASSGTADGYKYWKPNQATNLEGTTGVGLQFTTSAFICNSIANGSNGEYIYLAIAKDLTGPNSTQLNLLSGQDLEYFTTGTEITSNLAANGSNISFGSNILTGNNNPTQNIDPYVDGQTFFDIRPSSGNKWLAWIKNYTNAYGHRLYDSERNNKHFLRSNGYDSHEFDNDGIMGPNGDAGYLVGLSNDLRGAGMSTISWNFLAAPQFFDVQKYVGTGSTQTIQHDLGVEPGCILVKSLDSNHDWRVYHSGLTSAAYQLYLNYEVKENIATPVFDSTDPTSSVFTVGPDSGVNLNGGIYIAYLFAKDTPYVKCGSYNGAGASTQVNVGFQPRWMMIKRIDSNGSWVIIDKTQPNTYLKAESSSSQGGVMWNFTSTGVTLVGEWNSFNNSSGEYVYIAIADESEGHPPSPPSSSTVTETPDPATATMVVNAESFDVGDSASAPALEASITTVSGAEGNSLLVDSSTGTWVPGLYAKGAETTVSAPSADEVTFTSTNAGTTSFSGVDATLSSRTWTLESGPAATGPWTVVDTYVDYDALSSQDGATPWSTNKPALAADTFYRVKVQYDSTNAESVESVYSTFKTSA